MFFSVSKCCDKWCIIQHQKQFNKHILTILISKHKTLWPESCYILTVTKMSITSLSKVMECLDNVKICLLNRFWWRDSCNACHEIWQHHKTIFMATFQKVLLDRFMSSRCFLYLVLPPLTQCTNANKLYSNVFFYRSEIEWLYT